MLVGLVVEYCCHGRKFSLFVDVRLILPTDNSTSTRVDHEFMVQRRGGHSPLLKATLVH